jgi:hypothetical protein
MREEFGAHRYASNTGHDFVDSLNDAVRENPVSAALIGMGVLWMFFGGSKVSGLAGMLPGAAKSAAGSVGSAAGAGARAIGGGLAAATSRAGEAAQRLGNTVSSSRGESAPEHAAAASSDGAATLAGSRSAAENPRQSGGFFEGVMHSSTDTGRDLATSLQKNLTETFERQPLLVGAIGLAIGAGIASAFSATAAENKLMGETRAAAKERIQEFASETADMLGSKAKQAFDEVTREAETRGLTPSAAKSGLQGMADKVQSVAGAARESIKGRL